MALNGSGPISLGGATSGQSIALELGQSATGQISLNDTNVRTLAGVASGAIVMPTNFWGKSNRTTVNLTISSNTQNYNIFGTATYYGYVAGKSDVILTINSGVVVGSSSTGSYALDTGTGWTSGDTIKIVNNGYIVGRGGNGGNGGVSASPGGPGTAGGPALRLQYATSIQNNSVIGGGGGGGGGGGTGDYYYGNWGGGGGGGAGNTIGSLGSNGGGGGTAATTTNGGKGNSAVDTGRPGGNGGAAGVAGSTGTAGYYAGAGGGGGGGLGASGGTGGADAGRAGGAGAGAGAATNGAGTYATWLATGSRYGTIG